MEWFDEFVKETVREWAQKDKDEVLKLHEFLELMVAEGFTTVELGKEGEHFVRKTLINKKYQAVLSAASRTPSDVWAITNMGEYHHIMLVQVKTTEGDRPASLNQENVDELKALASFVVNRLKKSSKVPKEFSIKSLVLSIGYAGIISDNEPQVHGAKCYCMWYADKLANTLERVRVQVRTAHRLQA